MNSKETDSLKNQ